MPGATEEAAVSLERRLVSLVDAHAKTLHVEPRPGLSIGLERLCNCGPDVTPESLLHAADQKLYQVKKARKNAPPTNNPLRITSNPPVQQHPQPPISRSA